MLGGVTSLLANTGGPDGFGYTYIDSYEAGGPVFSWIEIAPVEGGSGIAVPGATDADDSHDATMVLSFPFSFYGNTYTNISIGSNGPVYFEDVYLGLANSCIPGTPGYTMTTYDFIAAIWDDLNPSSSGGGDIYFQSFADYAVIEYYQVYPYGGSSGDTWEIILFSNGNILFQYKEVSEYSVATGYTTGIQGNPTTGLQYVCDGTGNPIADSLAILFLAPGNDCSQGIVDLGTGPFCLGDTLIAPINTISNVWNGATDTTSFVLDSLGTNSLVSIFNTGCSSADTITVGQIPIVTYTETDSVVCNLGGMINLTEGTPAGGSFSGIGVSGNTFDPSSIVGTNDVTYTITEASGCVGSDTFTFLVNDCLGLKESSQSLYKVFPNPTVDFVKISGVENGDNVSVYTVDGKLLLTKVVSNNTLELDLSTFESAVYIVKINDAIIQVQKK